jgi:transcriptional regulator with XRE-family HTH domain
MSEFDPYKHIRALARSIMHMEKQIEPAEPAVHSNDGSATRGRPMRRNEAELEAIAEVLKSARVRLGLTQRELGRLAEVPQSHISKIEAGGVDLRLSSLMALAGVLELRLELQPMHGPAQSMAPVAVVALEPPPAHRSPALAAPRRGEPEDLETTVPEANAQ